MSGEQAEALYSVAEAARILDLPDSRLRYWAQTGLVNPSASRGGRPHYTFRDLITLRAARGLTDAGVTPAAVRRALDSLRATLPDVEHPIDRLRIWSDGGRVVAVGDGPPFEPATGQVVMEFSTGEVAARARAGGRSGPAPAPAPDQPRRAAPPGPRGKRDALDWFREAGRLKEQERWAEAEAALRRAGERDPHLGGAWTNLGNLRARAGDRSEARRCFERALEIDPDQAEARFNLANLHDAAGEVELAIAEYRRVLRSAPEFADAHYNLGAALIAAGARRQARDHFRRFVELAPDAGEPWAAAARRYATDAG